MGDETYSGWKNYPTWAVNLWLANDEPLYHETLALAREALEEAAEHQNVPKIWTEEQAARFELADALKAWVVDELAPDLDASFASDLLGYAFGCVDWEEIAESWLESARYTVAS